MPAEKLKKLYKDGADYRGRVNQRLAELVRDGWFLTEYADAVRGDVSGR